MAQNAYHNQISDKYEIQGSDDYGKAIKLSVRQIEYEIDAFGETSATKHQKIL